MPALNHEAVMGGLARAYDDHGKKMPNSQMIIMKYLMGEIMLVLVDAKRHMPQGRTHGAWG